MRAKQPSVLRGIITGATAGIAATLIMDQFLKLTTAGQKAVEKQMKLAQGESPWEIAHEQVQQEQQAAARKGRQLTREDPVPQTIYRVMAPDRKGMLVNLRLKYGK